MKFQPFYLVLAVAALAVSCRKYPVSYNVIEEYDEKGRAIRGMFIDEDSLPVQPREFGYCYWEARYDDARGVVEDYYKALNGLLTFGPEGYAQRVRKFTHSGFFYEVAYYDTVGHLCIGEEGFARMLMDRDDETGTVEGIAYDTKGKRCCFAQGQYSWTRTFDTLGRELEYHCYDRVGQPYMRTDGFHSYQVLYDSIGEWMVRYTDTVHRVMMDTTGHIFPLEYYY